MALQNPWIGYIDRTYQQIKTSVTSKVKFLMPEMTDNTEQNLFMKILSIWSGIAEMLGYYIDSSAREGFLFSARRYKSAIKHARANSYRVKGPTSSSTLYRYTISAAAGVNIPIPQGSELGTPDGISFFTVAPVQIDMGDTFVEIPIIQRQPVTGVLLGVSDGSPDQEYELPEGVADGSTTIIIQSTQWAGQDSLAFSLDDSLHFVAGMNENQRMSVRFGDGVNGLIPPAGANIFVSYGLTQGAAGNVGSNTITEIISPISLPPGITISGNNELGATGGSDPEDIARIRKNIAILNRVSETASGEGEYAAMAELAPGVEKAGEVYNYGKQVEVYIAPIGGGIASPQLISDVSDFIRERKMITTDVFVFSAGEVAIILGADIFVLPNYERAVVGPAIIARLEEFGSAINQEIGGLMDLGDIYEVIEGTTGVRTSDVKVFTTRPYARPLNNSHQLVWTRETQPASSATVIWRLVYNSGTDSVQLLRNGSFVGTFNVGDVITRTEIIFTINAGTYSDGDTWEFVTYKYFGSVKLQEPSTPRIAGADVTLNLIGGI